MKKKISIFLALAMLINIFCSLSLVSAQEETSLPQTELPTATTTVLDISEINEVDLTFAMNFLADAVTEEQLEAYGDWYADFVFTINKDATFNGYADADGYLAGSYQNWSEGAWVKIPFEEMEIEANTPVKIMEIVASEIESAEELTYSDVCNFVQEFKCGAYFTDEFLTENPDLKATLELRIYNNEDIEESYLIGETHTFQKVALPTATVRSISVEDLTYALKFIADEVTDEQLEAYGDWYADFEFVINKDATFNGYADADGYLAGSYQNWSEGAWVKIPFEEMNIEADTPVNVMEIVTAGLGSDADFTYADIYNIVQEFDCGVYFTDNFLSENPDLTATLELVLRHPENEEICYSISGIYDFKKVIVNDESNNITIEGSELADNTVEIKNVVTDEASEGTTDVTINTDDFAGSSDVIDTVIIPVAAVEAVKGLNDVETLTIVLKNGEEDITVSIDKDALEAIAGAAGDAETVVLKVEEAETLTENQTAATAGLDNKIVYSISFETQDGDEVYSSSVADGKITVSIPYEKSGSGTVIVRHLTDAGNLEDISHSYSGGVVKLKLEHFSEYVIYQKEEIVIVYDGGSSSVTYYTVKFDTNGGSSIANQRIKGEAKLAEPASPEKEGFTFSGWYSDKELTKEYDFDAVVKKSFTLYAKWVEEEKETDIKPISFVDVKEADWFFKDVQFVGEKGLMNGVTETEFAPAKLLTRAMLVTILYRNEGEPATNRSIPFSDIDMDAYYANAVTWAQQNGIVNGVTETEFAPDANITREQFAAIMFRYAVYKGLEAVTLEENLGFEDADEISPYAISAFNWAVGSGLINGKTETKLCPLDNATRAETAAILHRYVESLNK